MNDSNTDCKDIIMEYLLHYCYKDTAKALLDETKRFDDCSQAMNHPGKDIHVICTSTAPVVKELLANVANNDKQTVDIISTLDENSIEWDQIDARKDIHNAIEQGDIDEAFTLIENHFPNILRIYNKINRMNPSLNDKSILPKSHFTTYKLRCQQFVETLRTLGASEAIKFAKVYFPPCSKLYTEFTNNATLLIAYTDIEKHDRSGQHHRDQLADEVNEMILESQHFSPQTTLEKLWRQKTVIQVELDNQERKESSDNQQDSENSKPS